MSSSTKIKSSIVSWAILKVYWLSKPILPPKQSAKVSSSLTSTGLPTFKLSYIEGPLFIEVAIIFTSGFCNFIAKAIPPINPPPDVGMITVSTSGKDFNISKPTVPWPAITIGSSKGCIKAISFLPEYSFAYKSASSLFVPTIFTFAPKSSIAFFLWAGTMLDINIVDWIFNCLDAYATPLPWLPVDTAITPFFFCSLFNDSNLLVAPRNLKEPVICNDSNFKYTFLYSER